LTAIAIFYFWEQELKGQGRHCKFIYFRFSSPEYLKAGRRFRTVLYNDIEDAIVTRFDAFANEALATKN
jgi:hypothetical protein